MAMFDSIFAGDSGIASVLLNTMGISGAKLIRKISTYEPRTDEYTEHVSERIVTVSPPLKYSAYETANLSIEQSDCKIIGKGSDFYDVDNKTDQIEINGELFTIIEHKHVYSGTEIACTIMQARKQTKVGV